MLSTYRWGIQFIFFTHIWSGFRLWRSRCGGHNLSHLLTTCRAHASPNPFSPNVRIWLTRDYLAPLFAHKHLCVCELVRYFHLFVSHCKNLTFVGLYWDCRHNFRKKPKMFFFSAVKSDGSITVVAFDVFRTNCELVIALKYHKNLFA